MIDRAQSNSRRCAVASVSLAIALAACVTTPGADDPIDTRAKPNASATQISATGLPSQSLADGECGLFGWDTSNPPQFVFFATADRALYMSGEGAAQTLTPEGPFPSSRYGSLTLTLGEAEPLIEGTRYPQARVRELVEDGFTRVRPLVILQSCETPSRDDTGPFGPAELPLF